MKIAKLNIFFLFLLSLHLPGLSASAGGRCDAEEYMISASRRTRPEWVENLRFQKDGKEFFVGFSSQNERIDSGIDASAEDANQAILEAVGQVIQSKSEALLTLTADDVRRSFGSRAATAYFRNKEREGVYYEKWAARKDCRKSYYYNVWALVSVPKQDLEKEAERSAIFLLNLRDMENSGLGGGLLPDKKATHIMEAPKSSGPPPPSPEALFRDFNCGNITFMGGIDQPQGSLETDRGKFDKWGFNIFLDGEFSITRNVCGGVGVGYATLRTENGGTGSIIPFPFRIVFKAPFGARNGFIIWGGGEVGPAILYGFKNRTETDRWSGEETKKKKVEGGFWSAAVAGFDIRIQGRLYLTVSGAYVPVISGENFRFIMGRAGIRYYF